MAGPAGLLKEIFSGTALGVCKSPDGCMIVPMSTPMIDPHSFENVPLRGGFTIVRVELSDEPMVDVLGREAIARTGTVGRKLDLTIRSGLSNKELSVTLYHEILEAMTVAVDDPPASVMEFNEADFERAGYEAHERFGPASPANLNRMLQSYGFRGE